MVIFENEVTNEYAQLNTQEEFERWSAEMELDDILVRDGAGCWHYYTEVILQVPLM